MSNHLTYYKNILQVLYDGLIYNIISKEEVLGWADSIILQEDLPDYFFIELTLCRNKIEILELIGHVNGEASSATTDRALLGVFYHKAAGFDLGIEKYVAILYDICDNYLLSDYELSSIFELSFQYDISLETEALIAKNDIQVFLSNYKEFKLYNYKRWDEISKNVLNAFELEEAKLREEIEARRLKAKKEQRSHLFELIVTILVAITVLGTAIYLDSYPLGNYNFGSAFTVMFLIIMIRMVVLLRTHKDT